MGRGTWNPPARPWHTDALVTGGLGEQQATHLAAAHLDEQQATHLDRVEGHAEGMVFDLSWDVMEHGAGLDARDLPVVS